MMSGGSAVASSGESSAFYLLRSPPTPPSSIYGMAAEEIYSVTKEPRRRLDDPVTHRDIKAMLEKQPSVLLAVARVLHEPAPLRRTAVDVDGRVEEQVVPPLEAPPCCCRRGGAAVHESFPSNYYTRGSSFVVLLALVPLCGGEYLSFCFRLVSAELVPVGRLAP
ncbi:hypothetical protein BCY84_21580 [Trypanosoma cruzi cruzi]|uniref:Uncharacterized protein n=1 Tax=Trypanosoma cruzi TaxID=5693 RepID=A0A2V2VA80_TRYCR|nr:hypothetical protein BCY84_21580 [Trypanosoma cruzi cruzi]PWU91223.1 hypothetical protein C4B63_44g243 [Trypanosoma cruzi]